VTGEQHTDTVYGSPQWYAEERIRLLAENQRLRDALDAADWLIRNLQNVGRGKVVRGLGEALAGYESAREGLCDSEEKT
jgi:hypothetical protein